MDKHITPEQAQTMLEAAQSSVYLMGISFILGSLFTFFLLLVLDFVRHGKEDKEH